MPDDRRVSMRPPSGVLLLGGAIALQGCRPTEAPRSPREERVVAAPADEPTAPPAAVSGRRLAVRDWSVCLATADGVTCTPDTSPQQQPFATSKLAHTHDVTDLTARDAYQCGVWGEGRVRCFVDDWVDGTRADEDVEGIRDAVRIEVIDRT